MRPPICGLCDKDLETNEGGIVYFKKRFSDKVWERKMKRINGIGHPPYAEWFCARHYPQAKELQHLTIDKAFEKMRQKEKES